MLRNRFTGSAWMVTDAGADGVPTPADRLDDLVHVRKAHDATSSTNNRSPITSSSAKRSPRGSPAALVRSRADSIRGPKRSRIEASITPLASPIRACLRRMRSPAWAVAVDPSTDVPVEIEERTDLRFTRARARSPRSDRASTAARSRCRAWSLASPFSGRTSGRSRVGPDAGWCGNDVRDGVPRSGRPPPGWR